MLDALLLALAEASQEFVAGVWVEIDLFDLGQLPLFGQWTHGNREFNKCEFKRLEDVFIVVDCFVEPEKKSWI